MVAAISAACGPLDAAQTGGERADPVALLTVLPSPATLRGGPAQVADADALQRALTGGSDPVLAERIGERAPEAGVRRWENPQGGTLTATVSVWDSHLVATGVGADVARFLVEDGGSAWTPDEIRGSRGSRVDDPARRELRLAYSVGPNSLAVRATGAVSEEIVTRTLRRMIVTLRGDE